MVDFISFNQGNALVRLGYCNVSADGNLCVGDKPINYKIGDKGWEIYHLYDGPLIMTEHGFKYNLNNFPGAEIKLEEDKNCFWGSIKNNYPNIPVVRFHIDFANSPKSNEKMYHFGKIKIYYKPEPNDPIEIERNRKPRGRPQKNKKPDDKKNKSNTRVIEFTLTARGLKIAEYYGEDKLKDNEVSYEYITVDYILKRVKDYFCNEVHQQRDAFKYSFIFDNIYLFFDCIKPYITEFLKAYYNCKDNFLLDIYGDYRCNVPAGMNRAKDLNYWADYLSPQNSLESQAELSWFFNGARPYAMSKLTNQKKAILGMMGVKMPTIRPTTTIIGYVPFDYTDELTPPVYLDGNRLSMHDESGVRKHDGIGRIPEPYVWGYYDSNKNKVFTIASTGFFRFASNGASACCKYDVINPSSNNHNCHEYDYEFYIKGVLIQIQGCVYDYPTDSPRYDNVKRWTVGEVRFICTTDKDRSASVELTINGGNVIEWGMKTRKTWGDCEDWKMPIDTCDYENVMKAFKKVIKRSNENKQYIDQESEEKALSILSIFVKELLLTFEYNLPVFEMIAKRNAQQCQDALTGLVGVYCDEITGWRSTMGNLEYISGKQLFKRVGEGSAE